MSLSWKAASLPSRFLFVSFTILNIVVIGLAQPELVLKTPIDTQANSQRLSSILEEPPPDPDTPIPRTTVACSAYPQLEKECLDVNREFYNYQRKALLQRTAIFRFHHISTIIIFGMVLILVLAGLFFAWAQFASPLAPSTFKFGPLGFEITTSTLGVIILAISMAFFYLYLLHVYPIKEVSQTTTTTSISSTASDEGSQE